MVKSIALLNHRFSWAWEMFPEVIAKLRVFSETYDSDINLPLFEQFLRANFVSDKPTALMLVGLDEQNKVVGFLIAISELWFGTPAVTVTHLESSSRIPKEVWAEGEKALMTFAQAHGAKFIQLAARNKAVARLFSRRGYAESRILMKRPVEGRAETIAQ